MMRWSPEEGLLTIRIADIDLLRNVWQDNGTSTVRGHPAIRP